MAVMVPPRKYTICMSRPFLRNIPASLAIHAGRPLPLSVLLPMVSLMSWAEAAEQKENEVNRLTAKIAAFIRSSLSDPKIKIGNSKIALNPSTHPFSILDFGFSIVGKRGTEPNSKFPLHLFFSVIQNRQSKIQNYSRLTLYHSLFTTHSLPYYFVCSGQYVRGYC